MNVDDVEKVAKQIGHGVYELIMGNWDSIAMAGKTDPKQNGVAKVRLGAQISTIDSGSHVVEIVVPFRSVKDSTRVGGNDPGLEEDNNTEMDPSDPDAL